MISPEEQKKILTKLNTLNEFIRSLEEFSKKSGIDVKRERIYIAATAQKSILRDVINGNI